MQGPRRCCMCCGMVIAVIGHMPREKKSWQIRKTCPIAQLRRSAGMCVKE